MTGHDDFDRTLAGWFEADALSPAPADGLDRVLDATRRRRPRPAWLAGPGSHWVGEAHDRWFELRRAFAPAPGSALVDGAHPAPGDRGPAGWGDPGRSPTVPAPALPTGRLGHLAYGLDGDIYVADWDGRNPVRIADGAVGGGAGPSRLWLLLGRGTDVVARRAPPRLPV